jgi:hypothetical protein
LPERLIPAAERLLPHSVFVFACLFNASAKTVQQGGCQVQCGQIQSLTAGVFGGAMLKSWTTQKKITHCDGEKKARL